MNANIKIKLLLITITTLLVLGGAYIYYDKMFEQSMASTFVPEKLYITPNRDIVPITGNGNVLPKYKSSKRVATGNIENSLLTESNSLNITDLGVIPVRNSRNQSKESANFIMLKPNSGNQIFTTQALMVAGNHSAGKRGARIVSSEGSYTSSISSIPAPQLAGASFDTNQGLKGDPDDPSDDFLPPEGAPVGEGLMILLALAGVYLFRIRRE